MNEELTEPQRLWVEALESGKYEQTKGLLCEIGIDEGEFVVQKTKPVGYCCLGVLCEVGNPEWCEGSSSRKGRGKVLRTA